MTPIKYFIENNLFTKTGNLNNRVCIESWWVNRNLQTQFTEILNLTQFLPSDVSVSERIYCIYNNITTSPICQVCGGKVNFKNFKSGYYQYCSTLCATQSPERNEKIRINNDYTKITESMKKSNLKKYGVEYTFQSNIVKEKIQETKKEKYGDKFYNNQNKSIQTNLEKYGVKYTTQSQNVINKIELSKCKNHPELRDPMWLMEQNKNKSISQIAVDLGVSYRTVYMRYIKYNIDINFFKPTYNKQQSELYEYIRSITTSEIRINDCTQIKPKELDIYLPEYNLAIEYNGLYWHKEDSHRHLHKHRLCESSGIKLLQFWDYEWLFKQDIVKSIIRNNLGLSEKIYARKCNIVSLESNEYNSFLDNNHIQGKVNSSIRYGLSFNGDLVAVIGFGRSRFDKKHSHELLRFCNKLGVSVIGGFAKLLKHTIKSNNIKSIQTFCDVRLFNGNSYIKNGFTFSHHTTPGYFYFKNYNIKNRQEFQKHKMKNIFNNFNEEMSEAENANMNGWYRVYDCGQYSYTMTLY